jgi:hypothetical protein
VLVQLRGIRAWSEGVSWKKRRGVGVRVDWHRAERCAFIVRLSTQLRH